MYILRALSLLYLYLYYPPFVDWKFSLEEVNALTASPTEMAFATSVTRSGDLLDFGQLFKSFGNN